MASRDILLDTFQDNNAHLITAADMRQFVNSVYDEMILVDNIVDNLTSGDSLSVLSANQGSVLSADIRTNELNLTSLTQDQVASQAQIDQLLVDVATLNSQVAAMAALLFDGLTGTIDTNLTPTLTTASGIITEAV